MALCNWPGSARVGQTSRANDVDRVMCSPQQHIGNADHEVVQLGDLGADSRIPRSIAAWAAGVG